MSASAALRLRPLRRADELEAIAAHEELLLEDFTFLLGWKREDSWADHLAQLERLRRAIDLPPDRVPATFLIAEQGAELVGRVSIRHELNTFLGEFGGHVGYGVRPGHRRRGHATAILEQALIVARAEGIDRVLVTCDDDNTGSAVIIERAGGVLEDVRIAPGAIPKRRYWIA